MGDHMSIAVRRKWFIPPYLYEEFVSIVRGELFPVLMKQPGFGRRFIPWLSEH